MTARIVPALIAVVFCISVTGQEYNYEHRLRPKKKETKPFSGYASDVRDSFSKMYKAADKPRILILFDENPIQDMGGMAVSGMSEIQVDKDVELTGKAAGSLVDATGALNLTGSKNVEGRSHALATFRNYVPVQAEAWQPETIAGFERATLENALVRPLLDAGVIIVDRQTALDFHADEIFSAMQRDRLEAQRDVMKKVADILLSVHVGRTAKTTVMVSGDREYDVPTFSARILSIADARFIDVVSQRDIAGVISSYDAGGSSCESRARVLAYVIMDHLSQFWEREQS